VADAVGAYEERITVWRAASFEAVIARAEAEASEYAAFFDQLGTISLKFSQTYKLGIDGAIEDGDEVFSLIRDSELSPQDYIDRHFDTGTEYQGPTVP
jgi:hypothetical protein